MSFPASKSLPSGYVKLENNVIHSTFIENTQCTWYSAKYWRVCKSMQNTNPALRNPAKKGIFKYYSDLMIFQEILG